MKKLLCIFFVFLSIVSFCSCSNNTQTIDEEQVKNICELATLECYSNNLAITKIKKGQGFAHVFEKDRDFWLEYDGIVKIGIDMKDVSLKINKNRVTIKIPHATVLSKDFDYDTFKKPKIVKNKDSWINKNKITTENQQKAINTAQKEMVKTIEQNKYLMERSENRAKMLIENYINQVGKISGINYEIKWEFIETKE